jgi:ribonuclease Z
MRVVLLGTGGGAGVQGARCQTGVLVEIPGHRLLFDCGAGVTRQLGRAGVDVSTVTALFFTHYHSDHLVDYPEFVLSSWAMGRRGALQAYGPPGLARITKLLFGPKGVFDPDIRSRAESPEVIAAFTRAHGFALRRPEVETQEVLAAGDVFEANGYHVSAACVEHVPQYLTCLAYRVDGPAGSVVFSGDTRPLASMVEFARDAAVLIHDCTRTDAMLAAVGFDRHHTGPLALGRLAATAGVAMVVPTHFSAALGPEDVEHLAADIRASFSGQVVMGEDLLTIDVEGQAQVRIAGSASACAS